MNGKRKAINECDIDCGNCDVSVVFQCIFLQEELNYLVEENNHMGGGLCNSALAGLLGDF